MSLCLELLEPVPEIPLTRLPTYVQAPSPQTPSFVLNAANKSYKHQYSNIYFVRLRLLQSYVEEQARRRWGSIAGNPTYVPRVLDVNKGQLCFIIGTVYMDMPLKPNVLEDLGRDHSLPAPAPRAKYNSEEDKVMLEDESGRLCLVGNRVRDTPLVTGVVLGALGMETAGGDFEVVDLCFAGIAPQPSSGLPQRDTDAEHMDVDDQESSDEWVAIVSGLEVGATSPADAQMEMLVEYLTGEAGGVQDQTESSRISRLIIAGNSLAASVSQNSTAPEEPERKSKRYGNDNASFSSHPTHNLSAHLVDIAHSMPIHLLPGASDPSGTILPQQSVPRAMFGRAATFSSFSCETNPAYIRIGTGPATAPAAAPAVAPSKGKQAAASTSASTSDAPARTLLVHSGQPLDDLFKYVPTPPVTRLALAARTLHWRHVAPTAPDTLWCHPYFTADPFVITQTPDIYVIGNQPEFATQLVKEEHAGEGAEEREKRCRVVLVPGFRESGTLVLVNLRTLAVKTVRFAVEGMSAGGGET
ncbi:hypothetical protein CERSUDRAFT_123186 [Gelatoporia subvermispora B]|uniref:DNA-directed DNA polymerase n=1 Tax=Ceriporiopsis subvermispora (strain B) TaxID=914234 RepID=M2RII7_CERS8|nr:hypothetical protein CERSUDRAFT_123186 [Gelatoporia subvermispora B]